MASENPDHMGLATNPEIRHMLSHQGNGLETVEFSESVTKINKKQKKQSRVLLLTNRALYNIEPHKLKKCKRRISLSKITKIVFSTTGDDFVVHVPSEYDYHFRSYRREEIAYALSSLKKALGQELETETTSETITSHVVTKDLRKRMSAMSGAASPSRNMFKDAIRGMVSKKKKRFKEAGFNLDLTRITDRLIAMGYPSEDVEEMYRNSYEETYSFLETYHQGHYKVYNLCRERQYDVAKFHHRVGYFPFDDHNCPSIKLILQFCQDVSGYLDEHPDNVAAIHCKAGKGRTGVMISCYLLWADMFSSADKALDFFAKTRTKNKQGVTIPSQRRYVAHFESFLRQYYAPKRPFPFSGLPLVLVNARLSTVPHFASDSGADPYMKIYNYQGEKIYDSRKRLPVTHVPKGAPLTLPCNAHIRGNVKVVFSHDQMTGGEKMFHLWINTAFVEDYRMRLSKFELDKAHKDTHHKLFDQDFELLLEFRDDDVVDTQPILDPKALALARRKTEKPIPLDVATRLAELEHENKQQAAELQHLRAFKKQHESSAGAAAGGRDSASSPATQSPSFSNSGSLPP